MEEPRRRRGRGGPGGWIIVYEPELHLGDDVLVPDLAGWRRERSPDLSGAHVTLAPDWVGEVLSPRTAHHDRGPKADIYAREGVGHLWFVDPDARLIEAFALVDDRWSRLGAWLGDDAARIPPFDAVALELKLLWVPKAPPEEGEQPAP